MQYITDSKQINLCSNSATIINGSKKSVMLFNINNILQKEENILYNLISVVHAEIPISWYVINSYNNLLALSIGNYYLTTGDYNVSTFKIMLLSILPAGFTLTYTSNVSKYTLGYTSNFSILPSSTCYVIMGFSQNTTYNSVSNSIIMPFSYNFMGLNVVKIKSSVLKTNNIDTFSNGRSNTLITIPVNNGANAVLIYNNFTNFKTVFPNTNLDYIDISLTDEFDQEIDFDGIDNYITLQIDSIREHLPDTTSLLNLFKNERIIDN
jgi:hypothetical protein